MRVYARAGYFLAGATHTEIARTRLHARFPTTLFPSYHHHPSRSPLPSSSSSPFLLLAAACPCPRRRAHTRARTYATARSFRARLFPRRFRPPSQAPSYSPPRARSRTSRRHFFIAVVVAAVATIFPVVSFPGLNSGNDTSTPLDPTLPSPLLSAALRLQATLLHKCCCCCCCSIPAADVVLGVKSQGWLPRARHRRF